SVFYKQLFSSETPWFGKTQYDASPFERVTKAMAPGNSWVGADRGVSYSYRTNSISDSVRLWEINVSSEDDIASTSTLYQAGSLSVKETTDERGIKSITYADEAGRTVLTKMQLAVSPTTGHSGWLCTYYVYDELNNLRMILPPKAVEALLTVSWNLSGNSSIYSGLCYRYFYDSKNRVIMKYIPGK